MSFDFHLYRAAPGLPSLLEWERDHAEPLGEAHELRQRIGALFPSLTWQALPDGALDAQGTGASAEPIELTLRAAGDGQVQFVVTYASPPALRQLMSVLQLNYCCAPESGKLRDPFSVGADWGVPA